jgi:hypothetical protein
MSEDDIRKNVCALEENLKSIGIDMDKLYSDFEERIGKCVLRQWALISRHLIKTAYSRSNLALAMSTVSLGGTAQESRRGEYDKVCFF